MNASTATAAKMGPKGHVRGFWALIFTQFQGAFSDNLYRFIIVFMMLERHAASGADKNLSLYYSALGTILFSVPYLVFPSITGVLADRFSKRSVTIATKVWEVMVMILGLYAFYHGNEYLILFMLYLMFMQSAFFSPAKYGIIPELLPESRLSWGNGILGMTTFVAIIAGQGLAGLLDMGVDAGKFPIYFVSAVLILLSCAGLITSFGVTRVPAASPGKPVPILNPWRGLGRYFKAFFADQILWFTLIGGGFFWFAGAVIQMNIITYGNDTMQVEEVWVSILSAAALIGIAVGSLLAGYLSRGKIEIGLVPIGLAVMTVASLLLAIPLAVPGSVSVGAFGYAFDVPGFTYWIGFALLLFVGAGAGLFEVPLMALLQHRTDKKVRGGMIAVFNISSCVGILSGGLLMLAFGMLNMNAYQVFLITAAAALVMAAYLCLRRPIVVLRSAMWIAASTMYRLRVLGKENVPQQGGALLVASHRSLIDALFILASVDRDVRFVIPREALEAPWMRRLAKLTNAIPVTGATHETGLADILRPAVEAINAGEVVCIFAEGQASDSENALDYREAFTHVMSQVDAPVIPVYLDPTCSGVYVFEEGLIRWQLPWRFPCHIRTNFGKPMPDHSTARDINGAIRELDVAAREDRKYEQQLLHRQFIRKARWRPFGFAMADMRTPKLSFLMAFTGSIVLARKFKKLLGPQRMVGLMVPQSVGGALSNIALQTMGKIPINLNYTGSAASIADAAGQCDIEQVITSREFLKRMPVEVPGEPIYLEDIKKSVTGLDRITAMVLAVFCPIRWLERSLGAPKDWDQDDLATIVFSSGSEGEPKGVQLTHHNIASNMLQALEIFPHRETDRMMGILPFFHSFGYTVTLWLCITRGMGAVYHPNPLEAKIVGQLAHKYKPRFVVATPTFLQNFIRRCLPEEFESLDFVVTGAEKLPERVRKAFQSKFGKAPLEGYGTTECAPIVSTNMPDYRAPGYYEQLVRHGTIGQPCSGIEMKVTDQDTGEIIADDRPGVLHIKGPNIMKGYLHKPELTAEVLRNGWYNTGDVASLSEEGFITITDRVARFSKIGGEMVAHAKVEEEMHTLLDLTERAMSVTGLPDERKGERLVVLHTMTDDQLQDLLDALNNSTLPNLWRPRSNDFYSIEEIPVLGSGKVDLKRLRGMAKELDLGE
ncbi:MAG: MFS transporter [bacterium]|nr:MFS transporter [bacterium]